MTFSTAGSAWAADLTPAAVSPAYKAAPAAPVHRWTGCYIGVEGGGIWGRAGTTAVNSPNPAVIGLPVTNEYNLSGGLAGGTVGCNYQVSNWLFGIEGDASWTNKNGTAYDIAPFNTSAINTTKEKWFDTARGRVGYAWDHLLLYGTAGGSFAGTTTTVCTITGFCASDSQTRSGWVAGGGIEYAVWNNLTLKVEYLHADFGSKTYISPPVFTGGGTILSRSISLTDDLIRVGLNYKFDFGGQVVAKY